MIENNPSPLAWESLFTFHGNTLSSMHQAPGTLSSAPAPTSYILDLCGSGFWTKGDQGSP